MGRVFSEREKSGVTRNVMLMSPLLGAGIDIYVPSIPSIVNFFGTTSSLAQLSVSAYLFGYAFFQLPLGILADIYGRKNILIISTFFYCLVTYFLTLSPDIYILLVFRLIQGMSISAIGCLNKTLISDTFSGEQLAKNATMMTIAWALGPIIAPVIGGYFQQHLTWKYSFYFLSFYGFITFISMAFTLPETISEKRPFNFSKIKSNFIEMFSHGAFMGSIVCLGTLYGLIILFNMIAPFLIINELHYSPKLFGYMGLLMGVSWFLGNVLSRYFIGKVPREKIIKRGIAFYLLFSLGMVVFILSCKLNLMLIILPFILLYFVGGMLFPNFMGIGLNLFAHIGGLSGATLGSFFIVCTSIFSAIASLFPVQTAVPLACMSFVLGLIIFLITKFIIKIR